MGTHRDTEFHPGQWHHRPACRPVAVRIVSLPPARSAARSRDLPFDTPREPTRRAIIRAFEVLSPGGASLHTTTPGFNTSRPSVVARGAFVQGLPAGGSQPARCRPVRAAALCVLLPCGGERLGAVGGGWGRMGGRVRGWGRPQRTCKLLRPTPIRSHALAPSPTLSAPSPHLPQVSTSHRFHRRHLSLRQRVRAN